MSCHQYVRFTTLQVCTACGTPQLVINVEEPHEWPIESAECSACGAMACRVIGPPLSSLDA